MKATTFWMVFAGNWKKQERIVSYYLQVNMVVLFVKEDISEMEIGVVFSVTSLVHVV